MRAATVILAAAVATTLPVAPQAALPVKIALRPAGWPERADSGPRPPRRAAPPRPGPLIRVRVRFALRGAARTRARATTALASADWDGIAACESGGGWDTNTGNGFWGGLQFAPSTWFAYGGGPFAGGGPFPYSRAAQVAVAERVLAAQGPGAWPNCFR